MKSLLLIAAGALLGVAVTFVACGVSPSVATTLVNASTHFGARKLAK